MRNALVPETECFIMCLDITSLEFFGQNYCTVPDKVSIDKVRSSSEL